MVRIRCDSSQIAYRENILQRHRYYPLLTQSSCAGKKVPFVSLQQQPSRKSKCEELPPFVLSPHVRSSGREMPGHTCLAIQISCHV